jgi:release factor glutamine methyltransferase
MASKLGGLLTAAKKRLADASSTASLDAQLLMAHVIEADRAHVIAHPERELTDEQSARFEELVARRAAGEPMAYIFGRRAFYDREMVVSSAVLIPRPETELLVEFAIDSDQARRPDCAAVDVGTGSGAIAVTFAAHVPHATVYATDLSAEALDVARQNADLSAVKIEFLAGDLLAPLIERGITVDLLLANLPYITSGEIPDLDVSKYEPVLALDGGTDGLALVRRMMADAPRVLRPGGMVLLEIGAEQGQACAEILRAALPGARVEVIQDYASLDRIVRAEMGS